MRVLLGTPVLGLGHARSELRGGTFRVHEHLAEGPGAVSLRRAARFMWERRTRETLAACRRILDGDAPA